MLNITTLVLIVTASGANATLQTNINQDGRPERIFRPVSGLDVQDMNFLRQAENCNDFEVQAGQIAATKNASQFTTEFAKEMISDHSFAREETLQAAQKCNVTLHTDLPAQMEHQLNILRNQSGAQFDATFRQMQKEGHEGAIQLYKREIANGHDQTVKALAVEQLPTIELHYHLLLSSKTMMGSTMADHGL
jgi:putative membrane protein